ncbi:DUF262 domain-containing protein [Nesterenkonia halotolerans]|uniref:DUF262 domain-containing protein n=1 Tax=Nesterenkonia halotolerans TaxID=225325 RepID=UPI003EE4C560
MPERESYSLSAVAEVAGSSDHAVLEPKPVGDLTGEFLVPAYQRGYRWGTDEVGRLLDDIWESGGKSYYLQPIVVKARSDGRWELIDGQQRLTTLYLIFQFMENQGLQSSGAGYSMEYETRKGSRSFLQAPDSEQRSANIDFHHIYAAYAHIGHWFEKHGRMRQREANKLYDYFFETVKVIWYEAPSHIDSIALFTRLNVGRIPLTDAELVKALVLAKFRDRPDHTDKSEQVAAQWDSFERELRVPEVWSFVTGKSEEEATHIGLVLDTLADRVAGRPTGRHRPLYYTFETLRDGIIEDPQNFWDQVVSLHSLILGWYENRDLFHKVGYLVAVGTPFADLAQMASGLTKRRLQEALDSKIRDRLCLTREALGELDYENNGEKCAQVLLLMNVETVRQRDTSERYSFRAHSLGAWSLEHIHAQNAREMKRDEKLWAQWLRLHREALAGLADLEPMRRRALVGEIDDLLEVLADSRKTGNRDQFGRVKENVEAAFSASRSGEQDSVHALENLALLSSGDNSALSNSTFEVKRREIIKRDKAGLYIPPSTRNVFMKYYTESESQQLHYWGVVDRDDYLKAIQEALRHCLSETEELA